ncbi:hypothetical protein ACOSQ3_028643 [Xanthoceras sorbifolium]
MESFVADDYVLSGDFVSKISSTGVRETGTEQRGVQNAGVVLGSVGDTVLITGADTGGEVSVLLSYDSIIDSNSTDTVLITGANTGEKVNVLPGCDTIIDSNSAVVHAKGKMVEYGIVCSPKHREWKRLAREKARKRRSEVHSKGTKRALTNDLEDDLDAKRCKNADIAAAGSLAVAALAGSSVAAVVVLDAAGTSLAVVAPFASGAAVPRFSNTGSRQSLLGTTQDNRWVPPICGSFKLNVDAAFDVACGKFGLGLVVCDSHGCLCFAASVICSCHVSVEVAKAMAISEGIKLAVSRDLIPLSIESDSLNVVQLCNNSFASKLKVGSLVEEIRMICSVFYFDSVSFVPRLCNKVAHCLTKYALFLNCSVCWDVFFPNWLLKLAVGDLPVVLSP